MIVFFHKYPYMIFSVFIILVLGVFYLYFPHQRRPLIVSALFASPQALASLALVPDYWRPDYAVEIRWNIGLEDVLFNFYMGGVAWLLATSTMHKRMEVKYSTPTVFRRYLFTLLFGSVLGGILYLNGMRPIDISFFVFSLWILSLLCLRPSFWPLALSGATLGFLYAVVMYRLNVFLWPGISDYFNWSKLWGLRIGSIPMEEYIYFTLFCSAWALVAAFMLDVHMHIKKPYRL